MAIDLYIIKSFKRFISAGGLILLDVVVRSFCVVSFDEGKVIIDLVNYSGLINRSISLGPEMNI